MVRDRRVKLAIIIERDNKSEIEEHAVKLLKAQEKVSWNQPRYILPKGVPAHTALHAILCDDCNKTYWARDEYAAHAGCTYKQRETGFKITD